MRHGPAAGAASREARGTRRGAATPHDDDDDHRVLHEPPDDARSAGAAAFLRPRPVVQMPPGQPIHLADLAEVAAPDAVAEAVRHVPFGRAPAAGRRVVSLLDLLQAAARTTPEVRWQAVGTEDVVVEPRQRRGPIRLLLGLLVWMLLFVGTATTLLNFHADVNMPAAHRELYFLTTGRRSARPLIVEVPYAIGLALGAALFLAVPRARGADPGPVELEVHAYEERLRAYWQRRRQSRP